MTPRWSGAPRWNFYKYVIDRQGKVVASFSSLTKPEIELSVELIRRIAGRGITILLIEHVLTFLMSLSQHLLVLNQGRVLALGNPREVIAEPRVVEAYLGTRRVAA